MLKPMPERMAPLFILAPLNRSGTNFIEKALLLHPALAVPSIFTEDYLLRYSDLLIEYYERTSPHWSLHNKVPDPDVIRDAFLQHLGISLLDFFRPYTSAGKRLLLTTPRPHNLDNMSTLFPEAQMVIIIRDGRDTVESAAKTFKHKGHAHWMKQWAVGSDYVLEFMHAHRRDEGARWICIRFEEMYDNTNAVVERVLEFAQLDGGQYDWEALRTLPVYGSSSNMTFDNAQQPIWGATSRDRSFDPIARWAHWPWLRKLLFKRIAGRQLVAFGYESGFNW